MKNEKRKIYKKRTANKSVQKLHLKITLNSSLGIIGSKCGNARVNNLTSDIEKVTCKVCLKGVGSA